MKESAYSRGNKAFTLIELMVVVAIIAILVTMTMPVINRAVQNARIARVQTEVSTLESAFRAYYNAYNIWPDGMGDVSSGTEVNDSVVRVLTGEDRERNRRGIAFMEFPEGSLMGGSFVDAWEQPYLFVLDHNYDNEIEVSGIPEGGTLRRRVAVWSPGPPDDDQQGAITSW